MTVQGADSAEAVAVEADAIVVGTEWPEFGRLDWAAIARDHARPGHRGCPADRGPDRRERGRA